MRTTEKALIVPMNAKHEIFIQDRAGHKPPPWGFFGGSVEAEETPLQAVLRETKEELDMELAETDLVFVKRYQIDINGDMLWRNLYLYPTEQESFTVLEGAGGKWVSLDDAFSYLGRDEMFERVVRYIREALPTLK